jgi:hypothetical protein
MKKEAEDLIENADMKHDEALMSFVLDVVSKYYGVNKDNYNHRVRKREVMMARKVSMYLIKSNSQITLQRMAKFFGKNHATAVHSIKSVKDHLTWDKDLQRQVEELNKVIELKAKAINSRLDLNEDFYYIDLNEFVSIKQSKEKAIILVGYSTSETLDFMKKNEITIKGLRHKNKGMYVLEKYKNK